jgi:hypothetical protein
MIRKEVLIVIVAFCLTATLFSIIPVGSQGVREYDPWYDINDDGKIDLKDYYGVGLKYGTEGTPINKTDLLLQLMTKIDLLNATMIEQQNIINVLNETIIYLNNTRMLGAPDYDSGWQSIPLGIALYLTHNLNTTELVVYVIGRYDSGGGSKTVHQWAYGGDYSTLGDRGVFWTELKNTTIGIIRGWNDVSSYIKWEEVRVMIWKIPQP